MLQYLHDMKSKMEKNKKENTKENRERLGENLKGSHIFFIESHIHLISSSSRRPLTTDDPPSLKPSSRVFDNLFSSSTQVPMNEILSTNPTNMFVSMSSNQI